MKKKIEILIGTHNPGKFKELSFLVSKKYKKVSPLSLKIASPKETGKTFLANSKLKAMFFYKKTGKNVISDDSGLCIDCLQGRPGIYSARWAKKSGGFKKTMIRILKMVEFKNKNKKIKSFKARFVCSLTFTRDNGKSISTTGIIHGQLSKKIKGKNGFGYDPIFIPNKQKETFGEMLKGKKILMDHRFIAFKKLKKKVRI